MGERERDLEKGGELMLGKRPRPPMMRTTSMTAFAADLGAPAAPQPYDQMRAKQHQTERQRGAAAAVLGEDWTGPRGGSRRSSGDSAVGETAAFLRACGLCKRRLGPGRDTFMYRGEIAFCSLECRQQQMNLAERKDKCSVTLMKNDAPPATTTGSEASNTGETVAAA